MAENASTGLGEPPSVAALSVAETATTPAKHLTEQEINPWDVQAGTDEHGNTLEFDYVAISQKWNTKLLDKATLERFEKLTGKKPHRWLRRGLFFSHRDFDLILDCYERGDPFMLYTGRGPSAGSLHVGHSIPFEFTKWLQDVFDVPLVIMLTDDEKFLFKEGLTVEAVKQFSKENAKDVIAMGYDLQKTFIYSDFMFMGSGSNGHFYENSMEFSKLVNFNQMRGAFGYDGSTSSGRVFFPNLQCVAAFASSYPFIWGDDIEADRKATTAAIPCLIPCAIDQDPYFRLVRDNSLRMPRPSPKPALIHSKFLTSLQGAGGKMSASVPMSAIFLDDTPNQIKKKINASFSGGQETLELHQELGGNPDVDVPYQYLCYFEDDDEKLDRFYDAYKKGEMLTGEMKKECITLLQSYVKGFQEARAKVTDDVVKDYMKPRKLEWKGNPNPTKSPQKAEEPADKADAEGQKGQGKRAAKRAAKAAEKAAGDASKGA